VKALICLGNDNTKLMEAFKPHIEVVLETTSMMDAVNAAYHIGNPNDIVLLSPACASFDLFENFEDRGIQFKNAIREL
jgi:UDP-N-acetylmuramoylalanine--D-glutamate ligase